VLLSSADLMSSLRVARTDIFQSPPHDELVLARLKKQNTFSRQATCTFNLLSVRSKSTAVMKNLCGFWRTDALLVGVCARRTRCRASPRCALTQAACQHRAFSLFTCISNDDADQPIARDEAWARVAASGQVRPLPEPWAPPPGDLRPALDADRDTDARCCSPQVAVVAFAWPAFFPLGQDARQH